MRENNTNLCCFDNHDIDIDNVVFENNGDPVAAARKIFVSKITIYSKHVCSCVPIYTTMLHVVKNQVHNYNCMHLIYYCRIKENIMCLC